MTTDLFEYLVRLGDDRLVLGHRLSEWCGHAPILEEDIALANISLDLIGQANLLLEQAGKAEGKGRDQDALAYFREATDYRNILMVELPKGDFAFTIARQFFFSVFNYLQMEALTRSQHTDLSGIAAKAMKEAKYHARHSADWMVTLGDGAAESHRRIQEAVDELWRFTGEMFIADDVDRAVLDPSTIEKTWRAQVDEVMKRATLTIPETKYMQRGGREGKHTEHLGHMLTEMQIVARSFPDGKW